MKICELQKKVEKHSEQFIFNQNCMLMPYEILVTDCIYDKSIELCGSEKQKKDFMEEKEWVKQLNGTVVLGKTLQDTIYVLIDAKTFEYDNYTWRGTVFHELTHACDFYEFGKHFKYSMVDDMYKDEYFPSLKLWSEFHARKNGFKCIWKFIYNNITYTEKIRLARQNFELWIDELQKNFDSYQLMQYLGRFSVINELFPNIFQKPCEEQCINKLFRFLQDNKDFDGIKNRFGELVEYLKMLEN